MPASALTNGSHVISYRNVAAGLVSTPVTTDLPESAKPPQVRLVYMSNLILCIDHDVIVLGTLHCCLLEANSTLHRKLRSSLPLACISLFMFVACLAALEESINGGACNESISL